MAPQQAFGPLGMPGPLVYSAAATEPRAILGGDQAFRTSSDCPGAHGGDRPRVLWLINRHDLGAKDICDAIGRGGYGVSYRCSCSVGSRFKPSTDDWKGSWRNARERR